MRVHFWSEQFPDYKMRMRAIREAFMIRMKQVEQLCLVPKE